MICQVVGAAVTVTLMSGLAPSAMAYPVVFSAGGSFASSSTQTGSFTSNGGSYLIKATAASANDFSGAVNINFAGLQPYNGTGLVDASFGRYNGIDVLSLDAVGGLSGEVYSLSLFVNNGPTQAGSYDLSKLTFQNFVIAGIGFFPDFGSLSGEFYTATLTSFAISGTATLTGEVSPVPLPASLPMFGAALLGLGALGYGMKRRAGRQTA